MNEETVLETTPETVPVSESPTSESESLPAASDDWVVDQTEYVDPIQETEAITVVEAVQTAATDLAHVNLFGSFLICGTLVGIFLLRNRHAN